MCSRLITAFKHAGGFGFRIRTRPPPRLRALSLRPRGSFGVPRRFGATPPPLPYFAGGGPPNAAGSKGLGDLVMIGLASLPRLVSSIFRGDRGWPPGPVAPGLGAVSTLTRPRGGTSSLIHSSMVPPSL